LLPLEVGCGGEMSMYPPGTDFGAGKLCALEFIAIKVDNMNALIRNRLTTGLRMSFLASLL
jgi:hypothetical protein